MIDEQRFTEAEEKLGAEARSILECVSAEHAASDAEHDLWNAIQLHRKGHGCNPQPAEGPRRGPPTICDEWAPILAAWSNTGLALKEARDRKRQRLSLEDSKPKGSAS